MNAWNARPIVPHRCKSTNCIAISTIRPRPTAGCARWGLTTSSGPTPTWCSMATAGVTLDLLAVICDQLAEHLPRSSDPDMALNNLERFVAAARNPLSLGSLFERDREALPILLQIFATSQHLSDLLITDSESYDLLRITEGQPVGRESLVAELAAEVDGPGRRRAGRDDGPAPLQAPRDAADGLRRHHPRPAAGHRDAADLVPGRRDRRSRRAAPRARSSTAGAAGRARPTASRAGSSSWPWASWAASS